jgi:hypothetical protein
MEHHFAFVFVRGSDALVTKQREPLESFPSIRSCNANAPGETCGRKTPHPHNGQDRYAGSTRRKFEWHFSQLMNSILDYRGRGDVF